MEKVRDKPSLRALRTRLGSGGARVGLVPTMGYLHEGHLSLVRRARDECDRVVATIFVNPTQFESSDDLESYPRDEARDLRLLEDEGVDGVFLPTPDVMYHPDAQTRVEVAALSGVLMGALRPGHFAGVATVVTKLFNLVQPHAAYFGQKDYQQLLVIRTMVRDLDIPVDVVGVATAREADGLAMSSRNVRLNPSQRAEAGALYAAMSQGARVIASGGDVAAAEAVVRERLARAAGAEVASVDIRDAATLEAVSGVPDASVVFLLAVRFGAVLLIDNLVVPPKERA